MKTKYRSSLWLIPLVVVAIGCWVLDRDWLEPTFQGRGINYWMDDDGYAFSAGGPSEKGTVAIRAMGTNALPALLKMAAAKDSVLKKKLLDKYTMSKDSAGAMGFQRDWVFRLRAQWGFQILGATAKPAVPDLVRLLQNTNREVQLTAMMCLGGIGPAASDAVPPLMTLATNGDLYLRATAKNALGGIHAQPAMVIPFLVESLKSNPQDRSERSAIDALVKFGPDAKVAVPAIIPFLTNTNALTRQLSMWAITQIDPAAAKAAGVQHLPNGVWVVSTNSLIVGTNSTDPRLLRMRRRTKP